MKSLHKPTILDNIPIFNAIYMYYIQNLFKNEFIVFAIMLIKSSHT